jgi:adenosylcobinamide amidohydrolase
MSTKIGIHIRGGIVRLSQLDNDSITKDYKPSDVNTAEASLSKKDKDPVVHTAKASPVREVLTKREEFVNIIWS